MTIYAQFYHDVKKATADGRLVSEAKVFRLEPLSHLRVGPGKTREGEEGWTEKVVTVHEGGDRPIEIEVISHGDKVQRLAGAMKVLEQLGMLRLTEAGKETLPIEQPQPQEENNGNGHV